MIARIVFVHFTGALLLLAAAAPAANTVPAPAAAAKRSQPQLQKPAAAETAAPRLEEAAAVAPAHLQSQPAYRRYVHPGAKAMAGIDLARIASSPLGKKLVGQMGGMGVKEKAAAEGLDFVSDIEKLVLSSPGEVGSKGGPATLSEEAPFVVAMQGKFKIDKIRKSLIARKATRLMHGDTEVWLPAKGDTSLAIVNSQLMLLGDRKSLRATLEAAAETAREGAAPEDESEEPVRKRAGELAKMYDFWLVSDASFEGLSAAAPKVPQAEMLNGIDQIEVGVSFKQGLAADVSLHGRTPEETAKLGVMLAGVKALAALALQQKKQPELTDMLDKLKVGTSGERVMLSVKFSQKELDRGFASFTSPSGGNVVAKATTRAKPTITNEPPVRLPSPPAPALVVRIFNAEGGTREVPLSR